MDAGQIVDNKKVHWWPLAVIALLLINGCASLGMPKHHAECIKGLACVKGPQIEPSSSHQLLNLPYPNQKTVVAVYSFSDLTGQRKGTSLVLVLQ